MMQVIPAPLCDESNPDQLADLRDELQRHFWCDFSDLFPKMKWDDLAE